MSCIKESSMSNRSPFRLFLLVGLVATLGLAACGDKPTEGADGLNLRIETLYLVQSVQSRDGSVPLVAGKEAYLRIFVLANAANTLTPSVRVQLSRNGVVEQTITIPAPGASVPM